MNQTSTTLVFAAAGVVSLGVAWLARPASVDRMRVVDDAGERFFERFDALAPRSLEVVGVEEGSASRQVFKVAQAEGVWSIPSHEDYPADGQDKLARAAAGVMDAVKASVVTDRAGDHALYGVADPMAGEVPGAGSGTRVTMRDEKGETLVDMIIGKSVKDAPGLRYVRQPGRDRVYTAKVDTSALTTKFEDWIERDLLKLAGQAVQSVIVRDHLVDEATGSLVDRGTLTFTYDSASASWAMEGLKEGESLRREKLDALRNALADLKIVDVRRKPEALAKQLQDARVRLKDDAQTMLSLQGAGYFFTDKGQLVSNQGETIVKCADGVQYNLRFGEVAPVSGGARLSEGEESASEELGRYVFITAAFDQSVIPQPTYATLPELPATQPAASEPAATHAATSPELQEMAAAERERLQRENDERKAAYERQLEAGRARALELNRRFAEWYFVVSDRVYQEIRLSRGDVVVPTVSVHPEGAAPPGAIGAGSGG